MALEVTLPAERHDNEFWYDFDSAYIKIELRDLRIDFVNDVIHVPIKVFASRLAREKNGLPIAKRKYKFPLPTDNSINIANKNDLLTYCYNQLKQLPEFQESNDA